MKKVYFLILAVAVLIASFSATVFAETWITDKEPVTDYAYSFAILGDTQNITDRHPEKLTCIYDWIVDNAESKNIEFVFGLGDITNLNEDREYALAKPLIQKMDNVVPYSIVRGNHDKIKEFNDWFPYAEYADRVGGSYDGTMLNTYQKIQIGSIKYLIVNLDFGPSDGVLEWAGNIIEQNQDHNVIITTHAYLFKDGELVVPEGQNSTPPTLNGGYNDGIDIWNKLVKKYKNIVLVLSGHVTNENIVVSTATGDNGNKVTQMLINPQGIDYSSAKGMVAMLYFSADGKNVEVEYYSTVKDAFLNESNQFSMEIDVVGNGNALDTTKEIKVDEIQIDLEGEGCIGVVYAALFDVEGRLLSAGRYDAQESLTLLPEDVCDVSYIKLLWWEDEISLNPLCKFKTIKLK